LSVVDVNKNQLEETYLLQHRLWPAVRNFVVLSFLVSWQFFKDYHKILRTLGLDHASSTQWIRIVEWIVPFVKQIADWKVKEARTEAI